MNRIYLAGPVTGCSYDHCVGWRNEVSGRLADYDIECFSPMRGKEHLKDHVRVEDARLGRCEPRRPLSTPQGIVTRDRSDVASSDLMLANFLGAERVSVGTCVEIGWADAYRVPVVLVIEPEGNPHDHTFLAAIAGFRVPTLDDALEVVKNFLLSDVGETEKAIRKDRERAEAMGHLLKHNQSQLADEITRLHRTQRDPR